MKNILFLLGLLVLTLSIAEARVLEATVLTINDGDTVSIMPKGETKKARLRLIGVDTPEMFFNGESQGEVAVKARDYLRALVPIGSKISVELPLKEEDNNGRYLGVIRLNGVDVNAEMLKSGWGALFVMFPYDKTLTARYVAIAKGAYEKKFGIFQDTYADQPLPYMFRQEARGTEGFLLIGDYETKRLYTQENIQRVPPYARIFFFNEHMARNQGFRW